MCIMVFKINWFEPPKRSDSTDICDAPRCKEKRSVMIQSGIGRVIKDISHINHASEPKMRWCVGPVHGTIDEPLESLVSSFKRVLMLVVGFTGPNVDP